MYNKINSIIANFQHPSLEKNLLELKTISHLEIDKNYIVMEFTLPFAWQSVFLEFKNYLITEIHKQLNITNIQITNNYKIATMHQANPMNAIKGVKNIIAVSSGKGGVGKSTITVNLALALQNQGAKVGILDADIYGPSIPHMLGQKNAKLTSPDNKHMQPITAFNLQTNSIGYLTPPCDATIWRGILASRALMQLLQETLWQELDYLLIDLPPGTGDIQLTLAQKMPVTAAIVVTTPQPIALIDATKALAMFEKVNTPVIGIIENMSSYVCENCGNTEHIFGSHGGQALAESYKIPLLGQIPLNSKIRFDLDEGKPTLSQNNDNFISKIYQELAIKIATSLYFKNKIALPSIAIKNI